MDLQLKPRTVEGHILRIKSLLRSVNVQPAYVDKNAIREYLKRFSGAPANTYANVLKSLRVFFRDYMGMGGVVQGFKFPERCEGVKEVPDRGSLQRFYDGLESLRDQALFLVYATSGWRKGEVLELTLDRVDFDRRMLKPRLNGGTKRQWYTFYNHEADETLKRYLKTRADDDPRVFPICIRNSLKTWRKAVKKTGVHITPQMLRVWFCEEMGRLGVQDRYVDAFCGRTPKSVLARHYTDYSPDRLKEIYNKAGLRVLS